MRTCDKINNKEYPIQVVKLVTVCSVYDRELVTFSINVVTHTTVQWHSKLFYMVFLREVQYKGILTA